METTDSEEMDVLDELLNDIPEALSTGLDHVESEDTGDGPEITSSRNYFVEGFSSSHIIEASDYKKFIKAVERLVRTSYEYSQYLAWLKSTDINLDRCSIFTNVTSEDATIEMHHYPFSLYDLCSAVADRQFERNSRITTFSVADEVLKLHFQNEVGLVPLSVTMHNLVHSGSVFINLKQVFGKVINFLEEYKDFIDTDQKEKVLKLIEFSRSDAPLASKNFLELKELPNASNTSNDRLLTLESLKSIRENNDERQKKS